MSSYLEKLEKIVIRLSNEVDDERSRIAELEEEQVDDYLEASTYAISLFNAHYKNKADAVPIELCDTTRGVVTQIDNMVTGVIAELEKEKETLTKHHGMWKDQWHELNNRLPIRDLEQQAKGLEDYVVRTMDNRYILHLDPELEQQSFLINLNATALRLHRQAEALKETK
jgi:hypothetical protein